MLDSPMSPTPCAAESALASVLTTVEWQARAAAHLERVQQWTLPRRARRSRGESHPVYDFLFQYYSYSGGKFETWHPNQHELMVDSAEARERFRGPAYVAADGVIRRNTSALSTAERASLTDVLHILSATRDRPANFGCYGIHEWAMVYGGHDVRHAAIAPLRLPQAHVDAFVESRPIVCSHFDAFRFFAPAAKPMNRVPLAWSTRHDLEQPGCIHANMDLYRWAYTSMPPPTRSGSTRGNERTLCPPIRPTRGPKRGHCDSPPSEPERKVRPSAAALMHGPSPRLY